MNSIYVKPASFPIVSAASEHGWRVVVINLDDDHERRQWMRQQLEKADLRFVLQRATTGSEAIGRFPDKLTHLNLTSGEIGCWGSHLAIAEQVSAGIIADPVLVLEDDTGLPENLTELIDALLERLPCDWDIVHLSGLPKRGYRAVAPLHGDHTIVSYERVPHGTGAYLLRRTGAEKILRMKPDIFAIDQCLARYARFGLITYGVFPPPIRRDCMASRIDAIDNGRRRRLKTLNWKMRNALQKLSDWRRPPSLCD